MVSLDRNAQALEEVAEECRKAGSPDVLVSPHDLALEEECTKAVEETVAHFGGESLESFILFRSCPNKYLLSFTSECRDGIFRS